MYICTYSFITHHSLPLDRIGLFQPPEPESLHFVHDAGKWKTPESRKDLKGKGRVFLIGKFKFNPGHRLIISGIFSLGTIYSTVLYIPSRRLGLLQVQGLNIDTTGLGKSSSSYLPTSLPCSRYACIRYSGYYNKHTYLYDACILAEAAVPNFRPSRSCSYCPSFRRHSFSDTCLGI